MKIHKLYRGHRLYSLLGFLGLASVMFICFQLFSVKVLNLQTEQEASIAKKTYGGKSNHDQRNVAGNSVKKTVERTKNVDRQHGENELLVGKFKQDKAKKDVHLPREIDDSLDRKCIPGKDCPPDLDDWQAGFHLGEDGEKRYVANDARDHKKKKTEEKKQDGSDHKLVEAVDNLMPNNEMSRKESVIAHKANNGMKPLEELDEKDYEGLVRGILPSMRQKYSPDSEGKFTCLTSKERIPFSRVNDDYCDCADSSDEPGTSACPESRFYCRFQLPHTASIWLSSSLVNDGICDCCDGSDEWLHLPVADDVRFEDKRNKINIHQTPCSNRCEALKSQRAQEEDIRQKGALLKLEYIEKAKQHGLSPGMYGPDNAFFQLSQDCLTASFDHYLYDICPFQRVSQKPEHKQAVGIGNHPIWKSQGGPHGYVLHMEGGDYNGCPGSVRRKSILRFDCGLTDVVTSVLETEICEYTIKISTPAAC